MSLLSLPRDVVGRGVAVGLGLTRASVRTAMTLIAAGADGARQVRPAALTAPSRATSAAGPAPVPDLHDRMGRLLDEAVHQSTQGGRDVLFHKLLDELVPDEARILSALSEGRSAPLMHVYARTLTGMPGEPLLENACAVGKQANLALAHLTPRYVTHLLALGLVEIGAEDGRLKADYEILSADPGVLRAVKRGARGKVPPVVERRTLRLSALGAELWAATTGGGDDGA